MKMGDYEQIILELFSKNRSKELSSYEVAEYVFKNEASKLGELDSLSAKKAKAKLQRRVLYYLNKLCSDEILVVTRTAAKQQKLFCLSLAHTDDLIMDSAKKRIVIARKAADSPIDSYEAQGIVSRQENTGAHAAAIMLDASYFRSALELKKEAGKALFFVNDCLGIYRFEAALNKHTADELKILIEELDAHAKLAGKQVSCSIDISLADKTKLAQFAASLGNLESLNIVLEYGDRNVVDAATRFVKTNSVTLLNRRICGWSAFIGAAGVYQLTDSMLSYYQKSQCGAMILAKSVVTIDCSKLDSAGLNLVPFITSLTRSLFYSCRQKESQIRHAAPDMVKGEHLASYAASGACYLRLVNTDGHEDALAKIQHHADDFVSNMKSVYQAGFIELPFGIAVTGRAHMPSQVKIYGKLSDEDIERGISQGALVSLEYFSSVKGNQTLASFIGE